MTVPTNGGFHELKKNPLLWFLQTFSLDRSSFQYIGNFFRSALIDNDTKTSQWQHTTYQQSASLRLYIG